MTVSSAGDPNGSALSSIITGQGVAGRCYRDPTPRTERRKVSLRPVTPTPINAGLGKTTTTPGVKPVSFRTSRSFDSPRGDVYSRGDPATRSAVILAEELISSKLYRRAKVKYESEIGREDGGNVVRAVSIPSLSFSSTSDANRDCNLRRNKHTAKRSQLSDMVSASCAGCTSQSVNHRRVRFLYILYVANRDVVCGRR